MTSPGHPSDRASADHLPKLDGVRAFAILAVMLYHASWLQCGWAGVQAFFVLSGFLITRILVRSKERWQSSPAGGAAEFFSTFYWRRALRIFPLYYGFIGLLLAVHWIAGIPANLKADLPWLLSYTTNIERIFPDYNNVGTHSHLWSLAVEEQFYLIWPAIVWMTPRRLLHRLTWGLIAAGPILRLATAWFADRQWGSSTHSGEVVYNLLTSHLDAFAAGAAVAIGTGFFGRNALAKLAGCVAVTVAIGAWVLVGYLRPAGVAGFNSLGYPHNMPWHYQYVWGYSLLDFTFAFLIAALLQPSIMSGWNPFRWLEIPAITYLGRISYGLYVFHNPIQVIVARVWHVPAYQPFPFSAFFVSLAATITIAALSYHLMESWFLRLKERQPRWISVLIPTVPTKTAIEAS